MEEEVSFIYVAVAILILVIIAFVFAKPDNKRGMLSSIGLDLSKSSYESLKESEYAKKCLKALENATLKVDTYHTKNETDFLINLIPILNKGMYANDLNYLEVSEHYIEHSWIVANRRYEHCKNGNQKPCIFDFNDTKCRKKYARFLWENYQYPWPEDWLKKESFI